MNPMKAIETRGITRSEQGYKEQEREEGILFFRGLLIALPISLAMWAGIIAIFRVIFF